MAINTHISNWKDRSELVIDYYVQFIKVWIPYNAWYMHNFYDEDSNPKRDRDSAIISHINSTSNGYRDKIKSLLRGNDEQSIKFKKLIANLHFQLEANPIPNDEDRVSFHRINLIRNNNKTHSISNGNLTYFVEFKDQLPKTQKRWFLEVQKKRNNQTLHRIELNNWSLTELNNDIDFIELPDNIMRVKLIETFHQINPKKAIEIIISCKQNRAGKLIQPPNTFEIDKNKNLYFVNDYDLASKSIVQLIYDLRCRLFHGEINPNSSNMKVYEFAYEIQKILIKDLN